MIGYEQNTINIMRAGQDQHPPLVAFGTRRQSEEAHPHLSETQRRAVEQILASRDQVTALEGVAGAGKTTSLVAIREAAEREEYIVEGFAPTSRAAQKWEKAESERVRCSGILTKPMSGMTDGSIFIFWMNRALPAPDK